MNLKPLLREPLWAAIESNYTVQNYTGTILDAIYFLSSVIRDKTGLASDGVSLVGQALGGSSPKLKVNRLQTDSEVNVQKGTQQLLTGIYQAIRNPRSHEKMADSESDAQAIVLFIDYLLRIIDRSRSPFDKESFLEKVFDTHFVENDHYASLIAAEIPPKKRFDTMIEVWRRKEKPFGRKLRFFVSALSKLLSENELQELYEIISDDLKDVQDDDEMLVSLQATPPAFWPHYNETARLRIENRLIAAVKVGKYSSRLNRCTAGVLGTWLPSMIHPTLSTELGKVISAKLASGDRDEEDYVFQYFFYRLPKLYPACNWQLRQAIIAGLRAGKASYYDAVGVAIESNKQWKTALEEEYNKFELAGEPEDDEIPF